MIIKELIEILKQYPEDTKIYYLMSNVETSLRDDWSELESKLVIFNDNRLEIGG